MKIVYFSKGIRGSRCLAHVMGSGYQVAAVIAVDQRSELVAMARQNGCPILIPEKLNTPRFARELKAYQPDLFVLCGYNRILKPVILDVPSLGTINLHGGKLPDYRGAAPINWQLINGETTGGCSILYVDKGVDTGDIIAQEIYPIEADDTHASVMQKTLTIFPSLLVTVLRQIEDGSVAAIPQDPLGGQYYTRRYPRDSRIDWQQLDDVQVHNLVRAMHGPYPSAYTFRGRSRIEIDKTRLLPETIKGTPGRIPLKRGKHVVVIARNRGLLIEAITVEGQELQPSEFFTVGDDLVLASQTGGIK